METPTKAVLAAASVAVTVIALSVAGVRTGLTSDAPATFGEGLLMRLLYSFSHANIFHALSNAWCLVAVTRSYRMPVSALITAYAIAVLVPPFVLSSTPTMGLSGACFALIGLSVWKVARKFFLFSCALILIGATGLFSNVAAALHLWCLIAGVAIGFLNAPAPWRRK